MEEKRKKKTKALFNVTMGSYDGTKLCELISIFIQSLLESTLEKDQIILYRDNVLITLRIINSQRREKKYGKRSLVFFKTLTAKMKLQQI